MLHRFLLHTVSTGREMKATQNKVGDKERRQWHNSDPLAYILQQDTQARLYTPIRPSKMLLSDYKQQFTFRCSLLFLKSSNIISLRALEPLRYSRGPTVPSGSTLLFVLKWLHSFLLQNIKAVNEYLLGIVLSCLSGNTDQALNANFMRQAKLLARSHQVRKNLAPIKSCNGNTGVMN